MYMSLSCPQEYVAIVITCNYILVKVAPRELGTPTWSKCPSAVRRPQSAGSAWHSRSALVGVE